MYNQVAQRPDFKSALRVVEMVLNTQCYQYLWLMVYFGCLQVNPHIQAVRNMCRKGGWRVFLAELRAAEVDPIFKKKKLK